MLNVIENKKPIIFKVANGKLEQNLLNFWIGDKRAFNSFQKHSLSLKEDGKSELECIIFAFEKVIADDLIDTIGNFQVSVHTDENISPNEKVFLYSLKTELSVVEEQTIHCKEANKYYAVPLGTTGGGAYGISYLVSVSPSLHGVALHFFYGNFGVLFCPQISKQGIKIKNVNGTQFIEKIKEQYNLPMHGLVKLNESSLQYLDTRDERKN